MTDITQPVGKINPQTLSSAPIPVGTVLVDDPVALVDDSKALTGSATTPIPVLRVSVEGNAPKTGIHKQR